MESESDSLRDMDRDINLKDQDLLGPLSARLRLVILRRHHFTGRAGRSTCIFQNVAYKKTPVVRWALASQRHLSGHVADCLSQSPCF
ncbi:hypothetical protein MHYP_G00330960 [Metynnis hypsauchen]